MNSLRDSLHVEIAMEMKVVCLLIMILNQIANLDRQSHFGSVGVHMQASSMALYRTFALPLAPAGTFISVSLKTSEISLIISVYKCRTISLEFNLYTCT